MLLFFSVIFWVLWGAFFGVICGFTKVGLSLLFLVSGRQILGGYEAKGVLWTSYLEGGCRSGTEGDGGGESF